MITLAIDPGLMTGIAIWDGCDEVPYTKEIHTREVFYAWLNDWLYIAQVDPEVEVVIEEYQITQRTGELSKQYDALYIIGAVESMCLLRNVRLYMQSRSMKSFGTDFKLKHLGWWNPSRGNHQNDAMRHLLRHLVVHQRDEDILEKLKAIL